MKYLVIYYRASGYVISSEPIESPWVALDIVSEIDIETFNWSISNSPATVGF